MLRMRICGRRGELKAEAQRVRGRTVSAEAVFVDGHAHGGVHADFFEGGDFAAGLDAAGGDDGITGGAAKLAKPLEIGAGHGAFAINIGAEEGGAEGFELGEDLLGAETESFAPAVRHDAAFGGVQGHDEPLGGNFFKKLP